MTKILYIAGWGRSGTTILDNLLGQVEGFVSTGELHHIWKRGLLEDRGCGCGERVRDCPMWRQAFALGFGASHPLDPEAAVTSQRAIRTRHVRRLNAMRRAGLLLEKCDYAAHLKCLYDGIAAATGARVIVDSSKFPVDAVVAAGLPGYEVYVVHMVRDPRAVAFSWQRRKKVLDKKGGEGLLRRVGMVRSSLVWQRYNLVIDRAVKDAVGGEHHCRLTYERLASEPATVIEELIALTGEQPAVRPHFDGNEVDVRPTHTASGNPVRFSCGRTVIRADNEWVTRMSGWRKSAVTLLCTPTLQQMGYGWRR